MKKDLKELLEANIISTETAGKIEEYYRLKADQSPNRLLIIFGTLGAAMIGMGVILLVAHNWDELSRTVKSIFAFLPLLTGQGLCAYTLLKQKNNAVWQESSAVFLFFAVGASIALISQVYNIEGNLGSFLMTWMLLCLPVVYLMKSSVTSLLYLGGITYFLTTGFGPNAEVSPNYYWLLLALFLPYYYFITTKKQDSNATAFHHWLVPVSVLFGLGVTAHRADQLLMIGFFSLLGVFILSGKLIFKEKETSLKNGLLYIGALGTVLLLLVLSFDGFWKTLSRKKVLLDQYNTSADIAPIAFFFLLGVALLAFYIWKNTVNKVKPLDLVFLIFPIIFFIGRNTVSAFVLINILLLVIGGLMVREGAKADRLGTLNFGILIIAILIICRFFDTDLSFIIKGIVFILMGIACLSANYYIIKKRKLNVTG